MMWKKYPAIKWMLYPFIFVLITILLLPHIPGNSIRNTFSSSQAVFDRSGKLLRLTLSADEKYRLWIPYNQIPKDLIEVVLLKEDRYFWVHPGFNLWSLIRASWSTYITRKMKIGGSTITMQLARLTYRIKTRSISGKIYQIIKAVQLELLYSKKDILEAYFNLVPYGRNIEGIGAASLIYFSKDVSRLVFPEKLLLTVIPQSPSSIGEESMDNARLCLLTQWIKEHPEDNEKKERYSQQICFNKISELPFLAPHVVDKMLRDQPRNTSITTTIDAKLQLLFEDHIKSYVEQKNNIGIKNGAALLIDYTTMNVLASVGSADFFNDAIQGQVNGTTAKRSPGSSIKPFLYALAVEQGLVHPLTMLKDSPFGIGDYTPENYDGEFNGPLTVHDSLIQSRNVPAVQLATKIREPDFYDFLKSADIDIPQNKDHYGMTLVLGGTEITMEDSVRLYAMLANGGELRPLKYILSAKTGLGKNLLSPESCSIILDILIDNSRPGQYFHREWVADPFPIYWKTGTSSGYRDAWSVGIFGKYVLAVWIGNFDSVGNAAFNGARAAAPLFFQIADAIKSTQREYMGQILMSGLNLEDVEVCAVSGCMPNPSCPHSVPTSFIPGVSPITKCTIHRTIFIDPKTGYRVADESYPGAVKEVYEFWPSDLLKIFQMAGVPRRVPPPFHHSNETSSYGQYGLAPIITSPREGLVYIRGYSQRKDDGVILTANTDADVKDICWFANREYLGMVDRDTLLLWKAKPGQYVIRVVDDQGRSDATDITVYAAN